MSYLRQLTPPHSRVVSSRTLTPPNERETLLPGAQHDALHAQQPSSSSGSAPRSRRFRAAALSVVLSVLVFLLYAHSHLDTSSGFGFPSPAALSQQPHVAVLPRAPWRGPAAPRSVASSKVDRLSVMDEGGDVSMTYSPTVIDLLPSASPPHRLDSAASAVRLLVRFSDSTSAMYPLCTFRNVCASSSYVLLAFRNLTTHSFYALVLPRCHTTLGNKMEICRCFHAGYRPGLLPYAWRVDEDERRRAEEAARRMAMDRFGGSEADWTVDEQESLKDTRGWPTLQEMQRMREDDAAGQQQRRAGQEVDSGTTAASGQYGTVTWWNERAWTFVSALFSGRAASTADAPPYPAARPLYRSPFTYPARSVAPAAYSSSSADVVGAWSSSANLTLHLYSSHYWAVHKWVDHHHIAHWAQKLLVMHATIAHLAHACSGHRYRRVLYHNSSDSMNDNERGSSGVQDVREYVDVTDTPAGGELAGRLGADEWRLECLPPIAGVLFHATTTPPLEHEASIQQIAVDAMKEWIAGMEDEEEHESQHHSGHTEGVYFHPRARPSDRVAPLLSTPACCPAPASGSALLADFSVGHNIHSNFLFRQFGPQYDGRRHPRHLPPPTNHSVLSCFSRLSFSPVFGHLVLSAYDMAYWRRAAVRHFGFRQPHSHAFTAVSVPLLSLPSSSYLPSPPAPLPPSSRLDHALQSALSLLQCPPSRAIFVTRPDRNVVNGATIAAELLAAFNLRLDFVSPDERMPSAQQAELFHSAGLVLSAHSSQLINTLFSSPSAAVVEVTAEYYNLDFARYARDQGMFFRYAIGGEPQRAEDPGPAMKACVKALTGSAPACPTGEPFCVERVASEHCLERSFFPNKHKSFVADVQAVKRAVRDAIGYLHSRCYGRWANTVLTRLTNS